MTGEDILGMAQGFMSGYRFVDEMKTNALNRQQTLFNIEQDMALAPYAREEKRLAALDAARVFNMNKELDPWKMRKFKAEAQTVLDLLPGFKSQFKLNNEYNALNTQANMTTLRLQQARTVPSMNAALAASGQPERVAQAANGDLYYVDVNGKALTQPTPPDMFQFGLIDPTGGAKFATEYQGAIGQMEVAAGLKGGGSQTMYAPPDMGTGGEAVPATAPQQGQKPLQYGDTVYTPHTLDGAQPNVPAGKQADKAPPVPKTRAAVGSPWADDHVPSAFKPPGGPPPVINLPKSSTGKPIVGRNASAYNPYVRY